MIAPLITVNGRGHPPSLLSSWGADRASDRTLSAINERLTYPSSGLSHGPTTVPYPIRPEKLGRGRVTCETGGRGKRRVGDFLPTFLSWSVTYISRSKISG